MTRLIDADKLYPDCLTKEGTLAISQSQIADAPTVEARPHGEWIFHKDYNERKYGCNKCGNLNNIPSNFCPNCGGKMDGGEKE